jgi:hypothetical protein
MTETPRDPEGPDPALVRMLRRRSRKERHGRARGGKSYQSWGEYSPRNLHTTGDHSDANRWFYFAIFSGAILIVPLIIGLLYLDAPHNQPASIEWKVAWFFNSLLPFIVIIVALLVSIIVGSAIRRWWARRSSSDS